MSSSNCVGIDCLVNQLGIGSPVEEQISEISTGKHCTENLGMTSAMKGLNQTKETTLEIKDALLRRVDHFLCDHYFRGTSSEHCGQKLLDRPITESSSDESDGYPKSGVTQEHDYSIQDAGTDSENLAGGGYRKEVIDSVKQTVVEQGKVDDQGEDQEDDDSYPASSSDESCSNVSFGPDDQTPAEDSESGFKGHTGLLGGRHYVQAGSSVPLSVRMSQLQALPKLELHAHLNGCVRSSTLLELYLEQGWTGKVSNSDLECLILKEDRSLTECFRLFPVIHALTTDHAVVTRITKEAIEDFLVDNVVYLELRTTPKSNEVYGMSKRSYVEAVLAGFEAAGVSYNTKPEARGWRSKHCMEVRLLLSIDRRESTEAAMETVQLAWDMRDRGVVGVDLSGDPAVGHWETFSPALNWAKRLGIPLTLHCGEVSNPEEIRAMLAMHPSRLGHVCCLEEAEWRALLGSGIPVEVCLTSNVRTESVPSMINHHFGALYNAKHPVVLCTDDPGLFSTSLTLEYAIASTCFGLTEIELLRMAKSAIKYVFADDRTKLALHEIFDEALRMVNCVFTSKFPA